MDEHYTIHKKSKPSLLAPIFLFSNWRTGGTALAFSFRSLAECYVYTEPFNPTLRDPTVALSAKTSSWKSKHPPNQYYFKEYEPLLMNPDSGFKLPEVEILPYVLNATDEQEDLKSYLSLLISYANSLNKIPVFKFEQLEGSAGWVKANFPDSICVGISRDPVHQYISWLEQSTFGNGLFFGLANSIINKNLSFFESAPILIGNQYDVTILRKIFDVFINRIQIQHQRYMDFCVDISPESLETLDRQLERVRLSDPDRLSLWRHALQTVRDTCEKVQHTHLMIDRLENHLLTLAELNKLQQRVANTDTKNYELTTRNHELTTRNHELTTRNHELTTRNHELTTRNQDLADRYYIADRKLQYGFYLSFSRLKDNLKVIMKNHSFLSGLRSRIHGLANLMKKGQTPLDIFRNIYMTNYWGNADSRSGAGSDLSQTAKVRQRLPDILTAYNVQSMLDIPCGDWHWMKELVLDVDYIGADIVPELIQRNGALHGNDRCRFMTLDLTCDDLPKVDLVFSRDVLVHLSFEDIFSALRNIKRSGSEYFLTTTFTAREANVDIPTGHWRPLNLQKAPFNLPAPLMLIDEKCTEGDGSWGDKSLGLWRVRDLCEVAS